MIPFVLPLLMIQDPEQVRVWVEQLGDHDFETREQAQQALIDGGEAVLPMLESYAAHANLEVRSRLAEIRRSLTTVRCSDIFALAEKALDPEADPDTWRPALLEKLQPYFAYAAAEMSTPARENLKSVIDTPLLREYDVTRQNLETAQDTILVVEEAKGARLSSYVLVICRSGEFTRIGGAVVICLGALRAGQINDSVVFARSVQVDRDLRRSLIYAAEGVSAQRYLRECAVFAPGGVTSPISLNNLWLNGTKASVTQQATGDREISIPKISEK